MATRSRPFGMAAFLALCCIHVGQTAAAEPARVDFSRDVLPILSENCFQCHGPDEKNRKADLRFDTKAGALRTKDAVIVPGKSGESELIVRVASGDPDEVMPPPKSNRKLTAAQIETLKRWVDQGAAWGKHWAYEAPHRPELPAVGDSTWPKNAIDRFILARLNAEKLSPSPEADRITLIRRLSLDLLGLPPTIAEVDRFVSDAKPQAFEELVERLLASPHYGERWGRHWLDAARYADSDGYEKDKSRQVWAYRDWVINALNRDLPYDQFVIEQIAGDLLPSPTQDQRVATGFLRNSMINEEGGIDPEQFRMEAMFDRMDAVGKSILGITIQCAQCHDHKYDPLTQEEYYRLFAFLNSAHESQIAVFTPEEEQRRADIFRQIGEIEADLQHRHPDWRERMAAWEAKTKGDPPDWQIVRPDLDESGGQKHHLLPDGSVLAEGYAPTKHTTEFTVKTSLPSITAVRLELLNDPNLPLGGPGRSIKGLFGLTEFKLVAGPADGAEKPTEIKIAGATADVNPPERDLEAIFDDKSKKHRITGPIAFAIDGKDETAWSIDDGPGRSNVPRKAVFVFESPVAFPQGAVLTFKLTQNHGGWNSDDNQNNNLGRFRFSITAAADATADPLPAAARATLSVSPDKRTPRQIATVFSFWRTTVAEWRAENDRIESLWRQHPAGSSQLALQPREMPRETSVLMRGDFLKPLRPVTPGVPAFLHPNVVRSLRDRTRVAERPAHTDTPEPPRLQFARWLVDRNSPTTARSLVNRVWQAYFGTGLVSTSEDLGLQSEPPSHAELFDWLALEFMGDSGEPEGVSPRSPPPPNPKSEIQNPKSSTIPHSAFPVPHSPWSLKRLHRLIVTSATYRQSSKLRPDLANRDPQNRLLARGPRFRVEGEVVRDIALAASGLLDPKVGGPSVHPPAPAFLFLPPVSYGPKVWQEEPHGRFRRALYTFQFRSIPYPPLSIFDAPNGDFACVRRVRSNTPLQALTTLNEPIFVECARALALRTVHEGGSTDAARLNYAFRRCLSRLPTDRESSALLALLEKQTQRSATGGTNPLDLATTDPMNPPKLPNNITPAQLASWTAVSRVLLNLDETITKE